MAILNIITWLWGSKYKNEDVVRLRNAVRNKLTTPHRFILFTALPLQMFDPTIDVRPIELEDKKLMTRSCFCRLRMFDPHWQARHGLTGKLLSLDLDLVITNHFDPILDGHSTFKILQGVNAVNPNPFNASIMLLETGKHADVWDSFTPERAAARPFLEFPDDQGWIWSMLPNADGWKAGKESGIYGFHKPGWPEGVGMGLPEGAMIVSFIGRRKPVMYQHLPWVRKFWSQA